MQRYVAFLRGMNLGNRRVSMGQLRSRVEELGLENVQTFIASGNVLFTSKSQATAKLEERIAKHLEATLGYQVDTFIRTAEEVARIGRTKSFPEVDQPGITVHVGFFHRELAPEVSRKLAALRTDVDELRVDKREFYWLCRIRSSESKLWTLPEMRALRLPTSTMRNLTSIRKLIAKHELRLQEGGLP